MDAVEGAELPLQLSHHSASPGICERHKEIPVGGISLLSGVEVAVWGWGCGFVH